LVRLFRVQLIRGYKRTKGAACYSSFMAMTVLQLLAFILN